MTNFCGKCGSPLDENSELCPKCNPPKKVPKKHIGLKIVSVFLAVLILFGSVSGVLVYYRIADIPIVSSVMDAFGVDYYTKDTNTSDFTYHNTTKEHIEFDSTSGIGYVNNELLITTNKNVTKDELNKVLENIGGKIVGEITALNYYQIQLDKNQKYTELENLITKLKANEIIASVNYNYAFPVEPTDYTPNDKEWKNDWSVNPSGTNWGLEAIEAQNAWDSKDKMQSVNIGVIDTMFYTDHEDLIFAEVPLGNENAEEKYKDEFNSHGTHVSGIIGATFDNNKGIAGIAPTSNLYGASIWGICDYGYSTTLTYQISLYYLIEVNNCKAINISMADNLLGFCVAQENGSTQKTATAAIKAYSDEMSEFIKILINKGYEFVICVCAGNQNDGNYKYFKKDSTDTQIPYNYYSYSDFQKYLAGEESSYDYSLYKDRTDEISGRLIEAKNINANGMFAVIEDSEVRNRIIITGAVQNNADKNYTIASFSQCGAEVDILAPGVDIYSTSVKKGLFGNLKSNYEDMSGTSQATPIATAVSGLVFSINPALTGSEVKNIICNSGVGSYGQEKYKLINANNAVEKVLEKEQITTVDITGNCYEYAEGENLSQFSVDEEKNASLMFWINYGASASVEDFFFDWENNKLEYVLKGNRSNQMYTITFTPTDKGVHIKAVSDDYILVDNEYFLIKNETSDMSDNIQTPSQNPNSEASDNKENSDIVINEDSSVEDLRAAIIGEWYDPNFAVNYYAFFEDGSCKMLFSDSEPGTFEITSDKTLKIKMPWVTEKFKWDSNCLYSSVGWYFSSDGNLIIEGDILKRQ